MAEEMMLDIGRVGAQGDGVAEVAGAPVFVPFTLAGERVRAAVEGARGRLIEVMGVSPDRVDPLCSHFGVCGGCALQHMSRPSYGHWKREIVEAAFAARGIAANVADVVVPDGHRRRAVLTARSDERGGLHVGFHESQSHALVDLDACPVMLPEMLAFVRAGREFLSRLLKRRGEARVTVTMSGAGLDVSIAGDVREMTPELRGQLAKDATELGLARVSLEDDPLFEALPPFLNFGGVEVPLPPAVFIQAVAEAEAQMSELVLAGVGKAKRVADLFSGMGAFSFPLARRAQVLAADSDQRAIGAVAQALKHAKGIKPVTPLVRDLFREPLSPLELNEHDAVVFDPPRAGAEAQARNLARSKVSRVVAVSCNPATLARDARHLIDGGYRMGVVTPIDQFRYSPHVEAVCVFTRPETRRAIRR